MKKDYYAILGLDSKCNRYEIKNAYRELSKKYHPDLNNGETTEKFLEVREAYEILYDPEKRKAYDTNTPIVEDYTRNEVYTQLLELFSNLVEQFIFDQNLDQIDFKKGMLIVLNKQLEECFDNITTLQTKISNLSKVRKRIKRKDEEENLFVKVLDDKIQMVSQVILTSNKRIAFIKEVIEEVEKYDVETLVQTWQTYYSGNYYPTNTSSTSGDIVISF